MSTFDSLGGRLALACAVLLATSPLLAQARWESHGPWGGQVFDIAVDPGNGSVIFLATNSGVFKSVDGGASWTRSSEGLTDGLAATAVAVDPADSQRLFAAASTGSGRDVYLSTNGGASWSLSTTLSADRLLFEPGDSNVVYGASFSPDGVIKTINGGSTWSQVNTGLPPSPTIFDLAISVTAPATLYAAVGSEVFKTVNGGALWASASTGLPGRTVQTVAVDSSDPDTVYVGVGIDGVYKSSNGGATWGPVAGAPSGVVAIRLDPSTPAIVYAAKTLGSLARSPDGGTTWDDVDSGLALQGFESLAIDPSLPTTLWAGGITEGVFRSVDSGSSWSARREGLASLPVEDVAVDPVDSDRIYAAIASGIRLSEDGGLTWNAIADPVIDAGVQGLEIQPAAPTVVFGIGFGSGRAFKSPDRGATWELANTGLGSDSLQVLTADPAALGTLYLGTSQTVYRTTNGGALWTPGSGIGGRISAVVPDPMSADVAYAGRLIGGDSVYRSLDGGATWSPANAGLPAGAQIHSLAIDSGDPSFLLTGFSSSLYESLDAGETWGPSGAVFPGGLAELTGHPATAGTFYAGAASPLFGPAVRRTIDQSATWSKLADGLSAVSVEAITAAPGDPHLLAAATSRGVYRIDLCPADLTLGDRAAEGSEIHWAEDSLTVQGEISVAPGARLTARAQTVIVENGAVLGDGVRLEVDATPCG